MSEEARAIDIASLQKSLFAGPKGINLSAVLTPGQSPPKLRNHGNRCDTEEGIAEPVNNGIVAEDQEGEVKEGTTLHCIRRVKRQGARPPSRAFVRKSICLLDSDDVFSLGELPEEGTVNGENASQDHHAQADHQTSGRKTSRDQAESTVENMISVDIAKVNENCKKHGSEDDEKDENEVTADLVSTCSHDVDFKKENDKEDTQKLSFLSTLESKLSNARTTKPTEDDELIKLVADEVIPKDNTENRVKKSQSSNITYRDPFNNMDDVINNVTTKSSLKSRDKIAENQKSRSAFTDDVYMSKSTLLAKLKANRMQTTHVSNSREPSSVNSAAKVQLSSNSNDRSHRVGHLSRIRSESSAVSTRSQSSSTYSSSLSTMFKDRFQRSTSSTTKGGAEDKGTFAGRLFGRSRQNETGDRGIFSTKLLSWSKK